MTGKHRWVSVLKKINEQILWQGFGLSIVCLLPVFACAWFFNNLVFLKIGLITISLFIAAKQLKYGFAIISFHYVLILTGFTLLYFSSHYFTPLFIFLCALMALGCIVLTRAGHKLQTQACRHFLRNLPGHPSPRKGQKKATSMPPAALVVLRPSIFALNEQNICLPQ